LTKEGRPRKVAEAAAVYYIGEEEDESMTTISSKNQITLPAHLLRQMGIGPGDRLAIGRDGNKLILRARPKDWVSHYAGSLAGTYGETAEEIEAYICEQREDGGRAEEIERAWSGQRASDKA
jgi:AbrB family looped-hinge helix DNA binding protein